MANENKAVATQVGAGAKKPAAAAKVAKVDAGVPVPELPEIDLSHFVFKDQRGQVPFSSAAEAEGEMAARELDAAVWQVVPYPPGYVIAKASVDSHELAEAAGAVAAPAQGESKIPLGHGDRILKVVVARGGDDEPKVLRIGHNGDSIHVQRGIPVLIRERFWNSLIDAVRPRYKPGIMRQDQVAPEIDGHSETASVSFRGFATEKQYNSLRNAGRMINQRERMSQALRMATQQAAGGGPAAYLAY